MSRPIMMLMTLLAAAALAAGDAMPLRPAVEFQPRDGLPNVLAKLQAGGEVRIAYFGGSITAAAGWRVKTLAWFRSRYPAAKISEIHAAIGGTGSDLGVYRLGHDVLRHKPDLVFVEFAVNDAAAAPEWIQRCMEGIVRQTWQADPTTDLCYVYTLTGDMLKDLQAGSCPRSASAMEALADHYGIPSINLGVEVAARARAGSLVFKAAKAATPAPGADPAAAAAKPGPVVFTEDNVHPLDAGHEIYAQVIARSVAALAAAAPRPHAIKPAFIAGNLEQATMLPLDSVPLEAGWTRLDPATDPVAKPLAERMPSLYVAKAPGTALRFAFTGTAVGVYDLLGPDCGRVVVSVDGGAPRTVARFDGYCTYRRIAHLGISSGLADGPHTVEIRLDATPPDKAAILFAHNRPDLEKDPAKYAAANWYAGGIMLVGRLLPR